MNRRSFAGRILAIFGAWGFVKKSEEPSYILDWNKQYSTHPDYDGKNLPYGPGNVVTLNGKDVSNYFVEAIKTGKNGWVRCQVRDRDSKKMTFECFDLRTGKRIIGPELQTIRPANIGERLKTVILRGNVQYKYDENTHLDWIRDGYPNVNIERLVDV